MEDQNKPLIPKELTKEEEKEYYEGNALYEMSQNNPGWQIVKKWLEDKAFHTWISPMEAESKEQWLWREENAFHAANNAAMLLEDINKSIQKSDYLGKVKSGEITTKHFKI